MNRRRFVLRLGYAAASLLVTRQVLRSRWLRHEQVELYPGRSGHLEVWGLTSDPLEADGVFARGAAGVVGVGPAGGLRLEAVTDDAGVLFVREIIEK